MTDQSDFSDRRGKKYAPYLREAYRIISRQKAGIAVAELMDLLKNEKIQGTPLELGALAKDLDRVPTLFQFSDRWYTVSQFIIMSRGMSQDDSRALLKEIIAKQVANRGDQGAA